MSKDCNEGDRISDLPESILHHILSFLHIEDVARTSVLSKRWKYIWICIPTLHFKKRCWSQPTSSDAHEFMEFVDGTLHRHKLSNVDSFSLTWGDHLNESRVQSWISNVVSGNVKELSLNIKLRHPRCIPLSLFTCQSLTSLELGDFDDSDFTFAKYFSFPRLKRLKLVGFNFCDECWNDKLFSNSPVIEEMVLEQCKIKTKYFCISIPTLKLLEVDCQSDEGAELARCVFKIVAPRLVTITYSGFTAKEYVLSSFPELVEADVRIQCRYDGAEGAEISRLLVTLAHVKSLAVNEFTIQAIMDRLLNGSLTFQNVQMLSISDTLTTDEGLIALLNAVPNMESLVFNADFEEDVSGDNAKGDGHEDDGFNSDKYDGWALDIVTTECLFSHLKSVCFQRFDGSPMELRWVKLILRKAKALQSMTIDFFWFFQTVRSKKEVRAEISSFPRASAGCRLSFIEQKNWSDFWRSL